MSETMLKELIELIKAVITDANSPHAEDSVRMAALYSDFVERWCK